MTDNLIPAPALRGDDPLGFLASVGVMALTWVGAIPDVRLGWSQGLTPHAEFASSGIKDTDGLGQALADAVAAIRSTNGVVPTAPTEVPLIKKSTGKDPNRMSPTQAATLFESAGSRWLAGDPWPSRWVAAFYGQIGSDEGRVILNPVAPRFAQMSLRTSLYEKTYEAMEHIDGPGDALTGWVRTRPSLGYDGANLDGRAKRDSSVATHGKAANQGAPSPTWLASMSPLLMPVVENRRRSGAVGWQAVRLGTGLKGISVVWPIWDGYLDALALPTLLGHPALEIAGDAEGAIIPRARQLQGLGIRAVYGSSRSEGKYPGPMAPARRLWPSNPDRRRLPS